ncbi:MAG: hypothetical protein AVDCRST_MAG42-832, partial [uncultured Chthoniobacterales bacterium]
CSKLQRPCSSRRAVIPTVAKRSGGIPWRSSWAEPRDVSTCARH